MDICNLRLPQFVVAKGHNIFVSHKEAIIGRRALQFVVAKGQKIIDVIKSLFAAYGHHSSLWPKATMNAFQKCIPKMQAASNS